MQPRQMRETSRPVRPSLVYFIAEILSPGRCVEVHRHVLALGEAVPSRGVHCRLLVNTLLGGRPRAPFVSLGFLQCVKTMKALLVIVYLVAVQLSHNPSTQVLDARPSRSLGQGRPCASIPVRVSRAP